MKNINRVLIFGEIVVDQHKDYNVIAGAPLHVAVHLKSKNIEPCLCSAVGLDNDGKKILSFLDKKK